MSLVYFPVLTGNNRKLYYLDLIFNVGNKNVNGESMKKKVKGKGCPVCGSEYMCDCTVITKNSLWEDERRYDQNLYRVTSVKGNTVRGGYINLEEYWDEENPKERIIERKNYSIDKFCERMTLLAG